MGDYKISALGREGEGKNNDMICMGRKHDDSSHCCCSTSCCLSHRFFFYNVFILA